MSLYTLQVFGCTDTGNVRPVNEDHILVGRFIKNHGYMKVEFSEDDDYLSTYGMLFAVADGIGGENAGEVASEMTLQTVERHFYSFEKKNNSLKVFKNAISAATKRANDTVIQVSATRPECAGMGSTISGICLTRTGYLVFNAGDSRVYRFRNGILKQLTEDDTLVNIAIQAGRMTREEAAISDERHTITNSVGTPSFCLKISEGPELHEEDILLLCSDGLHDLVPIERMEEIISYGNVELAGRQLLTEAMANGGHDNISLILIRYAINEETREHSNQRKDITDVTVTKIDTVTDSEKHTIEEK